MFSESFFIQRIPKTFLFSFTVYRAGFHWLAYGIFSLQSENLKYFY